MNWYIKGLKQYFDFKTRARRTEFWMFVLFNFILSTLFSILDSVLLGVELGQTVGPLNSVFGLAVCIPSISVAVRRLHDIGKSGWMMLIGLIPVIGAIWLIILYIRDGDPNSNKYGQNPILASEQGHKKSSLIN